MIYSIGPILQRLVKSICVTAIQGQRFPSNLTWRMPLPVSD